MKKKRRVEPELLELEIEQLTAKLKHAQQELDELRSQPVGADLTRRVEKALRDRVAANFLQAQDETLSPRARKLVNVRADEGGIIIGIVRFVMKGETHGRSDD